MKNLIDLMKNNSASLLGNAVAVIYFICPMLAVMLILFFSPVGFLMEISTIRNSGFSGPNNTAALVGICGFSIGLSLLIPPLRKMYKALPWLYSFVKIFFLNMVILCIGVSILNYGYQVVNEARHTTSFVLMIVQIIVCRGAMSYYFRRKPIKYIEGK